MIPHDDHDVYGELNSVELKQKQLLHLLWRVHAVGGYMIPLVMIMIISRVNCTTKATTAPAVERSCTW
jgi:hypothetical protein